MGLTELHEPFKRRGFSLAGCRKKASQRLEVQGGDQHGVLLSSLWRRRGPRNQEYGPSPAAEIPSGLTARKETGPSSFCSHRNRILPTTWTRLEDSSPEPSNEKRETRRQTDWISLATPIPKDSKTQMKHEEGRQISGTSEPPPSRIAVVVLVERHPQAPNVHRDSGEWIPVLDRSLPSITEGTGPALLYSHFLRIWSQRITLRWAKTWGLTATLYVLVKIFESE